MDIVRNLQRLVYEQLRGINFGLEVGLYSYPPREVAFPYLLIAMEESRVSQNFGYEGVRIKMKIKIFDRSENNARILGISDGTVKGLENLQALGFGDLRIIGVFFGGSELKLYSEINPTWSNSLDFEVAVERVSPR
ncbi:MAG: hypothetical protein LBU15_01150 [Rickettsiales bacterium]|jgi:hypothetical protein|nr:hypothetical protein [Rickettsiales bacterium]